MNLRLFNVMTRNVPALLCGAFLTMAGCQGKDAIADTAENAGPATTQPAAADSGVAVVELFTSEGCSSCPPAEAELAKIVEQSQKSGRPIFALAFHVDYWNNLGWADPFSSAAYSKRQSQYGQALGLNQIYTPQMIVNGRTEFVGSDQAKADEAITASLQAPSAARIDIAVNRTATGGYKISYSVTGVAAGDAVNVAVVERGLVSQVKRGENAGRTLEDANVVRWFKSETVSKDGKAELILPALPDVHFDKASVIAYLQRAKDLAVLGASSARFPK